MQQKYLIVLGGATASGKTSTAIKLAQHFDTVILSSDSRQFYREMNIGTAKPTAEELEQATHFFINSLSIFDSYTVGDFEQDALQALETIYQNKAVAVMAGGSGLFIRAVCEGLDHFPEVTNEINQRLEENFKAHGLHYLQAKLKEVDPIYYAQVDIQNPRRLMRALAVFEASNIPFSSFQKQTQKERSFCPIYILLDWERSTLYDRINQRVNLMMKDGLLAEARTLLPHKELKPLQTVGYQELFDFLEGKTDLEAAIELIKRNTRRYAKRQMTWFRKRNHWKAFHPSELEAIVDYINHEIN